MKKKNLKRLMLNKEAISNIQKINVTGGDEVDSGPLCKSRRIPCPPPPKSKYLYTGCADDRTKGCPSWNVACVPPL